MKVRAKQLWAMMTAMSLTGVSFASTAGAGAPAGAATAVTANTISAGMITGTTPTATKVTATASGGTGTGTSAGATTPVPAADGQSRVANKVAAPFTGMAGSQENAVALATALRTGTTANLTFTSTSSTGATTQVTTALEVPTKPMGWGNVSHALALAQYSLRQAGIRNPTPAELQAALDGGTVTAADGKSVALAGVLQQRAQGMGWGQIAKAYGTTMGAVNRGVKAPTTSVASSTPKQAGTTAATRGTVATGAIHGYAKRVTTASGAASNNSGPSHGSKGLTTASGALANNGSNGHAAKGITTATNATAGASSGLVTAAGNGQANALGRGVVTAAGGGSSATVGGRGGTSGVVTGAGATPNPSTTHESSGNAGGHGKHSG